jgi:Holliday junction resolvase RusA-like endonuclease
MARTKGTSKKNPTKHSAGLPKKGPSVAAKPKTKSSEEKLAEKNKAFANYKFTPGPGSISTEVTSHMRVLKCRIDGIPRPLYRNFAKHNTNPDSKRKVNVYQGGVNRFHKQSFENALKHALDYHRNNPFSVASANIKAGDDNFNLNPVELTIKMYFPRPKKGHYTYNFATKKYDLNPDAPVYVTKTPDIDNLLKLVLDCFQNVFFNNDKVVAAITAKKLWYPNSLTYQENQEAMGYSLFKLTEYVKGTTQQGCPCEICKTNFN